jgi:hypothetical protein
MREDNNKYYRGNGDILNHALFLNYLDSAVLACYEKASGYNVMLPALPPVLRNINT